MLFLHKEKQNQVLLYYFKHAQSKTVEADSYVFIMFDQILREEKLTRK